MTEDELQNFCRVWQSKLRLNDWDIGLELVLDGQMDEGNVGEASYHVHRRQADIKVLNDDDVKKTIVHELLHVLLCPLSHGRYEEPSEIALEQIIEALSDVLVRAE